MSSGTMFETRMPCHTGREGTTQSAAGYVAVRNGRVVILRLADVPRTAMDAVAAIASLREAAVMTTVPELRLSFNRAADHLTRELAGEVATFERTIEKATANFCD